MPGVRDERVYCAKKAAMAVLFHGHNAWSLENDSEFCEICRTISLVVKSGVCEANCNDYEINSHGNSSNSHGNSRNSHGNNNKNSHGNSSKSHGNSSNRHGNAVIVMTIEATEIYDVSF